MSDMNMTPELTLTPDAATAVADAWDGLLELEEAGELEN